MTYHNRFRVLFDVTQSSECEININTEGRWQQEGNSLFFNGHTIAESIFTRSTETSSLIALRYEASILAVSSVTDLMLLSMELEPF